MNKINNFFRNKVFLVIMVVLLIFLVIGVGTYAWLTWRSTDNSTLTTTIGDIYTVSFVSGPDINANLTPVFDYIDGYSTDFSITSIDDTTGGLVTINLNINDIDSELCSESIKYVLVNENNEKVVGIGDLSEATPDSTITILSNSLLQYGTVDYTFYIYMDGNIENDLSIINKTFSGELSVSVVEGTQKAGDYITELYLNSDRESVTNNVDSNAITYSYAPSESLMKDRFGNKNNLQETGNLRYYGANPNNYIYFNCDDYDSQDGDSCEIWRIIGVFDGKLKIMRNDLFDEKISWDYDYNEDDTMTVDDYQNNWSDSSLMKLLNLNYLFIKNKKVAIDYWSFISGNTDFVELNISEYQMKNDKTLQMITTENWYLNPVPNNKYYADGVYGLEHTGDIIWNGKVGLVSASDYAYSVDFVSCNKQLNNYAAKDCYGKSWLNDLPSSIWTITSGSGAQYVYTIKSAGAISTSQARIGNSIGVSPVIYLDNNTELKSGDGSIDNPYEIN